MCRRGLELNRFCMSLMKAENRARFKADEGAYLDEWRLAPEQRAAVESRDFNAAIAEAQHFGLPFATLAAGATIVTELAGSALILTGVYRWLGALWLGGFTLIATFVANRFWEMQLPERFMVENSFFEHLGLVGGFLLVAWLDLRKSDGASN